MGINTLTDHSDLVQEGYGVLGAATGSAVFSGGRLGVCPHSTYHSVSFSMELGRYSQPLTAGGQYGPTVYRSHTLYFHTRDVEVGAPAVAHFLLGQPSAYIPKSDKSVTINFYWVKTNVRRVLNSLLDESTDEGVAESADHYVNFDGRTRRTSIYVDVQRR